MGWLVLLPSLALLIVINKRINPRGRGRDAVSILTMTVAFIAGCGLAATFLGHLFAGLISGLGNVLADMTGEAAFKSGLALAIAFLLIGIAVGDIWFDRRADSGAQMSAVLLPTILALVVGGAMGATGGEAVQAVQMQMASLFTQLGGR